MDEKENTGDNPGREPHLRPDQIVKNPNPKANENIRVRTEETSQNSEPAQGVGSEITDGEDA